jgi:gliding motility-associated-like protein
LNELVTGANLVINGDFSQGNTGFTSAYQFASPNTVEEQYFVGPSPQAWNAGMSACTDHTGSAGNGNMLMLNGAPQNNVSVWGETIKVQPNTNYAFAVWVATLTAQNPAQLQFSINGKLAGNIFTAPGNSCNWQQFYVTWNPGSDTSAVINVINQNTIAAGNDFALDDISFSAVSIQQDSVKITALPPPLVKVSGDSAVCTGLGFTLTASGASNYNWYAPGTVPGTINNNPLTATPSGDTTLVVRGYNIPGCYGYETVSVSLLPLPAITITPNKSVCVGDSVTLVAEAAEAKSYQWSPTASLNGYSTASPIAHPASSTTYVVTVTGYNGCSAKDSVLVAVAPLPHFSVSPLKATVCYGDTVHVAASGGDVYQWQPAAFVSNPLAASTVLYPKTSATYSVIITSNACNLLDTLTLAVSVNPLPVATVSKSNDIDCTVSSANLSASGGLTYLWYPAGSLNIATGDMVVASPGETTTYSVIATDGNGCSDTATIAVKVATAGAKNDYPMASAFTPNGDGINDCFGITFWGAVSKLNFTIFDRWGVIVFHTNSPSDCWDGTYKGQPQQPGAFVYQIQANTICGPVYRKGTVVLLR